MSEYFPFVFALASLLCGAYLLLLAFKIYKPKTTTEEKTRRLDEWHIKFGTISKICGTFMVIYGLYFFISHKEEQWTVEFKQAIFQDARNSKTISRYPQLADEISNCIVENITSKMTASEYRKIMANEPVERFRTLKPYIINCIDEFNKRVKELDSTAVGIPDL